MVGVEHGEVRAEVWLPESNSSCKLPSLLGGFRTGFTLDTTRLCGGWGSQGSWLQQAARQYLGSRYER